MNPSTSHLALLPVAAAPERPMTCDDCRYFRAWQPPQSSSSGIMGACRRHSPQLFQIPLKVEREAFKTKFPAVADADPACGDFHHRAATDACG